MKRYPGHYYRQKMQLVWNWVEIGELRIPIETYRISSNEVHVAIPMLDDLFYLTATVTFKGLKQVSDEDGNPKNEGTSHFEYEAMEIDYPRIVSDLLSVPTEINLDRDEMELRGKIEEEAQKVFEAEDWSDETDVEEEPEFETELA